MKHDAITLILVALVAGLTGYAAAVVVYPPPPQFLSFYLPPPPDPAQHLLPEPTPARAKIARPHAHGNPARTSGTAAGAVVSSASAYSGSSAWSSTAPLITGHISTDPDAGTVFSEDSNGTLTFSQAPGGPVSFSCESYIAASNSIWQSMSSAPQDGTIIEVLNTYGVAPTYSLEQYVAPKDGGILSGWMSPDKHTGLASENCMFWRPYHGDPKNYVDPTGGAQNTVRYWCEAMHRGYDAKRDECQ